jgi:uncharacterized protein (TIGR03437 family)
VTDSNPIHRGDTIIIYATGLGKTSPTVEAGTPAPADPLAVTVATPVVTLGGVPLPVTFAGLVPYEIGVYQINAFVPDNVPLGMSVLLNIAQSGAGTAVEARVVD